MENKCNVPPTGWECSRTPGHDGPCAATPVVEFVHPPLLAMRIWSADKDGGTVVVTGMTRTQDNETYPVRGRLFELNDPEIQGYLPSRVWYDVPGHAFRLSFYTGETLHPNVRPFKDAKTYMLVVHPESHDAVHYPAEWRLFIEHVVCTPYTAGIAYVFLFGEDLYDQIIATPKEDK